MFYFFFFSLFDSVSTQSVHTQKNRAHDLLWATSFYGSHNSRLALVNPVDLSHRQTFFLLSLLSSLNANLTFCTEKNSTFWMRTKKNRKNVPIFLFQIGIWSSFKRVVKLLLWFPCFRLVLKKQEGSGFDSILKANVTADSIRFDSIK